MFISLNIRNLALIWRYDEKATCFKDIVPAGSALSKRNVAIFDSQTSCLRFILTVTIRLHAGDFGGQHKKSFSWMILRYANLFRWSACRGSIMLIFPDAKCTIREQHHSAYGACQVGVGLFMSKQKCGPGAHSTSSRSPSQCVNAFLTTCA